MSVRPGERVNVGYVGAIDSTFAVMVVIEGPAYYIPVIGEFGTDGIQLALSRGAVGDLLTNTLVSYRQAYFAATPSEDVENGWMVSIFDSSGLFRGYLTFKNDGDNHHVATIDQYSADTIILIPEQPAGYGGGRLLAGIRYSLDSTTGAILYFPVTNDTQASANIGGLYRGANNIEYLQYTVGISFIFAPINPVGYLERTPPSMGALTPSIGISQCATMAGTPYGSSAYCNGWQQSRGFTREEDIREIIYYYSQDGTCGQSYNDNGIQVVTSIGDSCEDQICTYSDGEFYCGREGLPQWIWLIAAIILLILVIVIAIAVAFS